MAGRPAGNSIQSPSGTQKPSISELDNKSKENFLAYFHRQGYQRSSPPLRVGRETGRVLVGWYGRRASRQVSLIIVGGRAGLAG